jgi:hypothetical protein
MQPGACSDVQHLPPRVINNGRRTRAVYLEKVGCYLSGVPVSGLYSPKSPSPPPSPVPVRNPIPISTPTPSAPPRPPPRQRHQVVQMPPRLQVTGRCTAGEALSALVERQMCHPNSPNPKLPKPSCRRTGRRIDTDPSRTLASSELARPSFRSRLEVRSRRLLSTRKFTYSTVPQSQLSLVHLLASSLKPAALSCVSCNARMIARNGSLDGISSDVHDRFRPLSPHHTEREAYRTVLRTVVSLSRLWSNYNALFGMLHGLECVSRPLHHEAFFQSVHDRIRASVSGSFVARSVLGPDPRPPTPDPRP